jgi:uncharacterized protein YgiM (DUF1202 family)
VASAALAATVYVSTDDVQLRQDRSVTAQVVATLQRGEGLNVLQQDERWYYVATQQGSQGWVYRYKVSEQPPGQSGNVFAGLGGASSGVSIDESSSTIGIRGLNPVAERQAQRRGRRGAVQAVKKMEQFRVPAQELDQFLRSGRLGEYQRGQ